MLRPPTEGLQDDQVERALQQIDAVFVTLSLWHVENLQPKDVERQHPTSGAGWQVGGLAGRQVGVGWIYLPTCLPARFSCARALSF